MTSLNTPVTKLRCAFLETSGVAPFIAPYNGSGILDTPVPSVHRSLPGTSYEIHSTGLRLKEGITDYLPGWCEASPTPTSSVALSRCAKKNKSVFLEMMLDRFLGSLTFKKNNSHMPLKKNDHDFFCSKFWKQSNLVC